MKSKIVEIDQDTLSIFEYYYEIKIFGFKLSNITLFLPISLFFAFSIYVSIEIRTMSYNDFLSNFSFRYDLADDINLLLYFNMIYFLALIIIISLFLLFIYKKKSPKFSEYRNFKTKRGSAYKESDWIQYYKFLKFKINSLHLIAIFVFVYMFLRISYGISPFLSFGAEDLYVFIELDRERHFTYLHYILTLNKLFIHEYATAAFLYYYLTALLLWNLSER